MPRENYPCVSTYRHTLQRCIFVCLIAVSFGALTFGAGSSTLAVGTAVISGTTATVPLSFTSGTGNTAGLQWTVSVPGATAISVQAGPAATSAGKTISCSGNTCLLSGLNTNTIPNGTIATAYLTFPSSAAGTFPVQLTNVIEALSDGTAGVITSTGGSSTIGATGPALLSALQCTPTTLVSGQTDACSVVLSAPAPATGAMVSLSSSSSAVLVPATVTVGANASSAAFTASAVAISASQAVTLTASLNSSSQQATLSVAPAITLSSLQCADAAVFSNATTTCTASLTAAAVNPTSIALSVQNTSITVPSTASIPAGGISTSFVATAASVQASQNAILTASLANGSSTAFSITVMPSPVFLLHGSPTEVSGVSNGSSLTPNIAPLGLTGAVVTNGTGSVNFSPIDAGNGVYFLNCCNNSNNAYYKFTGTAVGTIFNLQQGQISFYLKSRQSFAQRVTNSSSGRYAFDVRDGNNNHLFYFLTQTATTSSSNYLVFNYLSAGGGSYYFVPTGTEDQLFGNGVALKVAITWNGTSSNLYLNDTLVKSVPYTAPVSNWTASSNFDVGAYEYLSYGGYNASDDIISDFAVAATAPGTPPQGVSNPALPPVVSGVSAASITPSGAVITWTTDKAATSQVAFGPTIGSEALTSLNTALTTAHSVTLTGLAPSTTYHYQAQSVDANGNLTTSQDFTFTTISAPAGPQVLLQLHNDASEVSALSNGSIVTPSTAPPGFIGKVVLNGSGSVNFAPAQSGNGVYFLNCCTNYNNAYYNFTGAPIGNVFGGSQGKVSFFLKSRYSFSQRQANAASPRFAFDVRDGGGNHLFYFITQVSTNSSGTYLVFNYLAAGAGSYYFVPAGTEDQIFGAGVILKVAITWNGSVANLYLNDALVKSVSYTPPTYNWSTGSVFDLGAYEYQTYGGYNTSDDIIDEVTVSTQAQP